MADSLYAAPSLYGLLFDQREHDLAFYAGLAAAVPGPVLELGVGTGRVALPLARAGCTVVGLDASANMLAVLADRVQRESQQVQQRLSWQLGDGRRANLGRRFELVLFPFNGVAQHHQEGELAALLANVRRHLTPAGQFAFDVSVPEPGLLCGASASVPWFRHPDTGEVCRWDESARYDPAAAVLSFTATIRWMESDHAPVTLRWELRQYGPGEVVATLERHDFEVIRADVDLIDARGYVCRPR